MALGREPEKLHEERKGLLRGFVAAVLAGMEEEESQKQHTLAFVAGEGPPAAAEGDRLQPTVSMSAKNKVK